MGTRIAAQSRKKINDHLRPNFSANQPKVRYPGNIPTRFNVTSSVVLCIMLKPRPPFSTDITRYGGIQVNSPHQANKPKKFSRKRQMVLRRIAEEKSSAKGARASGAASRCCCHISDSGTLVLIHSVASAGRMPTKKT